MKFSIVIPAYNEEKDIAGTFDGLPVLDYSDKEVIVVDDSTDATPEIVKRYAFKGVQLIHPERRGGRCEARNCGIQEATGEVVVILNTDVQPPRDCLWRMLQQDRPDNLVIATGESRSLEEFVDTAFSAVQLNWRDHVTIDPTLFRPVELSVERGNPDKMAARLTSQFPIQYQEPLPSIKSAA